MSNAHLKVGDIVVWTRSSLKSRTYSMTFNYGVILEINGDAAQVLWKYMSKSNVKKTIPLALLERPGADSTPNTVMRAFRSLPLDE